jgi:hypothetical protein
MTPIAVRFPAGGGAATLDEMLERVRAIGARTRNRPFADDILAFCNTLSAKLLKDPKSREFPQIVALGYWLRRSALTKLAAEYSSSPVGRIRVPRGVALHFPPANVDTIFVYSWLLSALAGNANIVRLPAKLSVVAERLLNAIDDVASESIRANNILLSYDRDDSISAAFSQLCDIRVVWGGDEKVRHIRALPLPPNATDINFANRFSLSAIKVDRLAAASPEELASLCDQFYNDVFWFDQMGCSSPRLVVWVGDPVAAKTARERFYAELANAVSKRSYPHDVGVSVAKFSHAYRAIIDFEVSSFERRSGMVDTVALARIQNVRAAVQGGGFLFDVVLDDLTGIAPQLRREDQTLTYFGFGVEELRRLVEAANGRGLDRIVPIGRALNFGHVWDGWDLIDAYSRLVSLET